MLKFAITLVMEEFMIETLINTLMAMIVIVLPMNRESAGLDDNGDPTYNFVRKILLVQELAYMREITTKPI